MDGWMDSRGGLFTALERKNMKLSSLLVLSVCLSLLSLSSLLVFLVVLLFLMAQTRSTYVLKHHNNNDNSVIGMSVCLSVDMNLCTLTHFWKRKSNWIEVHIVFFIIMSLMVKLKKCTYILLLLKTVPTFYSCAVLKMQYRSVGREVKIVLAAASDNARCISTFLGFVNDIYSQPLCLAKVCHLRYIEYCR